MQQHPAEPLAAFTIVIRRRPRWGQLAFGLALMVVAGCLWAREALAERAARADQRG